MSVCVDSFARGVRQSGAVLAVAMLLLAPLAGEAKTLYVATNGNDAVTYANNGPNTPWRTIGRAAWGSTNKSSPNSNEAARAGDVVQIATGTYTTVGNLTGGGNGRWDVAYNPINHGTASAPIRFECVQAGGCVLVYSSGAGPMIGSEQRNYIQWSGFSISESTAPTRSDTGPVTFHAATGGSIESSTLIGNPNWTARIGDNYPGIRLEDAEGVRIANNVIRNYGALTGDENHNGIETYRSYPITIENNYIANCAAGIYMKAVHTGTLAVDTVVIRNNIFEGNRHSIRVMRMPMTSARPMLIYQNIFLNWEEAGVWWNVFDNGPTDPTWIRVFSNTFVGNDGSAFGAYNYSSFKAGTNGLFWNNIVVGGTHAVRMDTTDITTNTRKDRFDFEHNLYSGQSVAFGDLAGANRTLQYWQSLGQDGDARTSDPLFVNRAGGDFRLQANSPARNLGRAVYGVGGANGAIIPAGAYITGQEVIGPSAGFVPSTLPSAPTGLRIVP